MASESGSDLEVVDEAPASATASDVLPSGLKVEPDKAEIVTRECGRCASDIMAAGTERKSLPGRKKKHYGKTFFKDVLVLKKVGADRFVHFHGFDDQVIQHTDDQVLGKTVEHDLNEALNEGEAETYTTDGGSMVRCSMPQRDD